MNSLDQYVPNMLLEKSEEIAPEGMRRLARGNNTQLWMCLVMKVKSDAVKNSIGTWNVRSMNKDKLEVVEHRSLEMITETTESVLKLPDEKPHQLSLLGGQLARQHLLP